MEAGGGSVSAMPHRRNVLAVAACAIGGSPIGRCVGRAAARPVAPPFPWALLQPCTALAAPAPFAQVASCDASPARGGAACALAHPSPSPNHGPSPSPSPSPSRNPNPNPNPNPL